MAVATSTITARNDSGPQRPAENGGQTPLYAARQTIYQREVQGPWQVRRAIILFLLAGFYIALPWLDWEGRQAVWFDVPDRRFFLFGWTFWPQDFIYLSGLLILGALSLFFFTNLAGRLWCGYACPQTVWTKFFMWMEWLTEGDRNQRILLDRGPWNARKVMKKSAKHASWLVFSALVGITFVGYFIPIRDFVVRLATFHISGGEWVFLGFASLLLYFDHGFMREQICKFACPYARFQGAMFDRATLTIFYDAARGEPRGRRKLASPEAKTMGDCVDCKLCVHVCPTGIDIRNGTQYECIGCAACIDACDQIMQEVGKPKGLVRYTTESALEGDPLPLLRPRVVGYGAMILVVAGFVSSGIAHRVPLDVDVIRDRARLYRELPGDRIENVYSLKIMNKSQHAATYHVATEGDFVLQSKGDVEVPPGIVADIPVQAQAPRTALRTTSTPITFVVSSVADPSVQVREDSRFLAPAPKPHEEHHEEHHEDAKEPGEAH